MKKKIWARIITSKIATNLVRISRDCLHNEFLNGSDMHGQNYQIFEINITQSKSISDKNVKLPSWLRNLVVQGWTSDVGTDGPTFVPKGG